MTRLLRAIQAIVAQLVAPTAYHALVRYRVVSMESGPSGEPRCHLQVVRQGTGFPSTLPVSMRTGVPGLSGTPAIGATVLVSFVEGDPSMPIVTHYSTLEDPAFRPTSLTVRVGATGEYPWEHVTSIEAVVGLLAQVLVATGATIPGPISGANLATNAVAIVNAAIAAASLAPVTPYSASISTALASKAPDPTSQIPSVGWPEVTGA